MREKVSIIIPTYNEEENIGKIIAKILSKSKFWDFDIEIIVMDDSSQDRTAEIAKELLGDKGKVIIRKKQRSLSLSVLEGFQYAEGQIIGVMDADMSHPPEYIPTLVMPILRKEAQLTIGSRYIKGGGIKGWPLKRLITSKIACWLARGITPIRDATSGFFFFDKRIIENVELNPRGFKIGLEIFVKSNYGVYKEVPYTFVDRKYGKSKLKGKTILEYLLQLKDLYIFKYKTQSKFFLNILIIIWGIFLGISYFIIDILPFLNKKGIL